MGIEPSPLRRTMLRSSGCGGIEMTTKPSPDTSSDDPLTLREAPDRKQARDAWAHHFEEVDVFVCPVAPTTAPVHDDRAFADRTVRTTNGEIPYGRLLFWISHANLNGLPAANSPRRHDTRPAPRRRSNVDPTTRTRPSWSSPTASQRSSAPDGRSFAGQ